MKHLASTMTLFAALMVAGGCVERQTVTFDAKQMAKQAFDACTDVFGFKPKTEAHSMCLMQNLEMRQLRMERAIDRIYAASGRCDAAGEGVIICY